MTELFQYPVQAFTDPETLGEPETPTFESWYRPLAEPVRALSFAAALIASGAVIDPEALADVAPDTSTEWNVPWQDQTYLLQGLQTADQLAYVTDPESFGAPLDDKLEWFNPLAEPVIPRDQVNDAGNIFVDEIAAPAEPDELQWLQPFPVADERRQWQRTAFWTTDPETLDAPLRDEVQWFTRFSQPVFVAHQTASDWFYIDPDALNEAGTAPVVTVDLSPVVVEGQSVLRVTEGLNVTRIAQTGGIKRIVEGVR